MDMFQSIPMPPPGFDTLTVEEQIDYVQSLWDHITSHPDEVPVPDWHKQILNERLALEKSEEEVLPAHFDGKQILLDEAVELEPNTKLLVTVLPKDAEGDAWLDLSAKRLQNAYGDEEEEYSVESIKEENPEHESR